MELEIQKFLRSNSLSELEAKFLLKTKRHTTYPNLVLFKYDQINSPMDEKVCQEARGIILDEAKNWEVVSFPYTKFWNHGDDRAALIDWNKATVYEKLDGSLMTLYWYDGKWRVASSGTPDASGDVNGGSGTFEELFWKVWYELGYHLPKQEFTGFSFMFELMTMANKIVVRHEKSRIVLHGMRDILTFQEFPPASNFGFNWEIVKSFPLTTIEEILKSCESIDPKDGEGFVVCDSNFNRLKVKTPQYVALAHIKDTMSPRRMVEIVLANEGAEVVSSFPEYAELYESIKSKLDYLAANLETEYAMIEKIEIQKDFALKAVKIPCNGILFGLRSKKFKTAMEGIRLMTPSKLQEILDL